MSTSETVTTHHEGRVAALGAGLEVRLAREQVGRRLAELTRRVLDVRGAVISLLDADEGKPFVAAASGLPDALTRWWGQTPVSLSLADPAGAEEGALAIADMRGHALLAHDDAVRELGIASYLGVPLRHEGRSLGSLVVLHHEPRQWTPDEEDNLRDLAALVVREVELRGSSRRQEEVRKEAAARSEAETRRGFADLVHSLDAVVHERDPRTGRFTFVSQGAEGVLGHPLRRWLEDPDFWEETLLHPADRQRAVREFREAISGGGDADLEYRARHADGRTLWLRDLVHVVRDGSEEPRLVRGVMVDVTSQREAREAAETSAEALRLLQEVATAANEASSLEEPLERALRRFCEHAEWPVGHAYLLERDGEELRPAGIWHLERPEAHGGFRRATDETSFPPGRGLPGRVLESGRPHWIESLADDPEFPRATAAAEAGLRGGFAFPVLAGRRVEAVLEFFFEAPAPEDPALLDLATHVGTILGRVAERVRSEAELQASEDRLRRAVETAHDAFISIGEDGLIREWNAEAERTFGWSREEAEGRELAELIIPEELRERHRAGLRHFLETGDGPVLNRRIELPALTREGRRIPVEITISPMEVGDGWVFNAFLHDISDRKGEEREREKRQRQLEEAQRLASIGSWEWNPGAGELTWSREAYRIFGLDPDGPPVRYETYRERVHPDDARELDQAIQEAVRSGTPYAIEHRVVRPDGEVRVVQGRGHAITDDEGETVSLIGTVQDLTERKALEERGRQLASEKAARGEAEAAKQRIQEILESITDAFLAVDGQWRITHANEAAAELFDVEREDLLGETLWEVVPDLEGTVLEEALHTAMREGEPLEMEERLAPSERWHELRAFPTREGLSVYLHDVHDRKRAEDELRASEARYRFLADSIPQQIWTALGDGSLDYVNRVVLDYFGREETEVLRAGWQAVVHEDDLPTALERWERSVATGEPYETEFRLRHHSGEHRWHLARARAQTDGSGEPIKWYGTNTDIHDQKVAEEERDRAMEDLERVMHLLSSERSTMEEQAQQLRETTRALRRSNDDLDRFAYVASHDLKAPLRGIANLAKWLEQDLEGELDGDTREYMDLLQSRVRRMEGLIDGILQYSRAGRSGEDAKEVDVRALVEEVVDMVSPPEHYQVRIDPELPVLTTPRAPLEQVFLNLVSNAVKHADGEDPVVRIRVTDEGTDLIEFCVSDNGPGIAEEYHDRIFTIFQTLKPRDEVEGTGIGLSVVKKLVERHGGQVWVESAEGQGASFRFLWPRNYHEGS